MSNGRFIGEWPALVLGRGLTALGVARSLAATGVHPVLGVERRDFAAWSRYCRRVPLHSANGASGLADALAALPLKGAVLMPCSDDWLAASVALPDSLRERFPASLPPAGAVRIYIDKALFAEALAAFEVPHPRTINADDRETIEGLSEAEIGGYFLKPCNSQAFSLHYRAKAISISGKADAVEKIDRFSREGFPVVVQEFIPGPVTNQYHLDGFIDRSGRTVASMARRRIRMYPTDFGNSTMLVSIPMEMIEAAIDPIHRLLRGLDHRGIFSAEFKWDERDGVFKLLEINARPWWQVEFSTLCGVNVCALAYGDALAEELPVVSRYAIGRRFGILAHDARAFRDLRRQGKETLRGWVESSWRATDAINRLTDPMPALGFALDIAAQLIREGPGRAATAKPTAIGEPSRSSVRSLSDVQEPPERSGEGS